MSETQLKPCPFCGGHPFFVDAQHATAGTDTICCPGCGARMFGARADEWNSRKITIPGWKPAHEYEELVEEARGGLVGYVPQLCDALEDAMLTLDAVLQLGIDKWLTGDQLKEEPAQRATLAREIALRKIEDAGRSGRFPTLLVDQAAPWEPSGADLPKGLSTNPDAYAWADAFVATFPNSGACRETMMGWFANAMCAVRDSSK